jgi:hypothetical protein
LNDILFYVTVTKWNNQITKPMFGWAFTISKHTFLSPDVSFLFSSDVWQNLNMSLHIVRQVPNMSLIEATIQASVADQTRVQALTFQ